MVKPEKEDFLIGRKTTVVDEFTFMIQQELSVN